MLTQSEILRTLVNNNCTDESVMSTALSPDCTPTKLLEKLTEAERLDIALDISMKLGLDVMPIWRTWAQRCLQNRSFLQAREKYRHCFSRLKHSGGRPSPAQSRLLADILSALVNLEENRLPLAEEVALIKKGVYVYDTQSHSTTPVTSKPSIYDECKYYLREYGCVEDVIEFNILNLMWDEAVTIMLQSTSSVNIDKFFLRKVIVSVTANGKFKELIDAFLKHDPHILISVQYFQAMYSSCIKNKRFNLLHYIQSFIGDSIAAGNTQVDHFFLRRPAENYKELNQRSSYLKSARKSYQVYLDRIELGNLDEISGKGLGLFASMTKEEVRDRLKIVDSQIDITHNFAINEISGILHGLESDLWDLDSTSSEHNSNIPVTLFDTDQRRKTFLTALVLIYFDISCSSYFSRSGFDLANNLISWFKLERIKVFKTAMRVLIEDESCDNLEYAGLLLERLREDYKANVKQYQLEFNRAINRSNNHSSQSTGDIGAREKKLGTGVESTSKTGGGSKLSGAKNVQAICDEVIRDSIGSCSEPDYKMELAKLLSGEAKIELYIQNGKLSNAQRLACSLNRPDYVSSIIMEATKLNQNHVKTVCQLWLANYETSNSKG